MNGHLNQSVTLQVPTLSINCINPVSIAYLILGMVKDVSATKYKTRLFLDAFIYFFFDAM